MKKKETTFSATEVDARLVGALEKWIFADGHIVREYRVNGFKSALLLANAIGHLAELAWHHPDLMVRYGSVTVHLRNHAADGITDKDFQLAERIEALVDWRPGAEAGALEGTPADPRFAYLVSE